MPPWGGGWIPPAPKPGVIPLQPLGVGAVIGGAFATFRHYWKPLVGIILAVQGLALLVMTAATGVAVAAVYDNLVTVFNLETGQRADTADVTALVLAFAPVGLVTLVTMLLAVAMINALCSAVVQEAVLGRPATFGAMWRRSWSRMRAVLGTVMLAGLIAGGPMLVLYAIGIPLLIVISDGSGSPIGLVLLVLGALLCAPVSAWLGVKFSLASTAAVCEDLGPVAALRRSSRLVEGAWWRVFGIMMLVYTIALAVSYAIQIPFTFIGTFALIPMMLEAGNSSPDPVTLVIGVAVYVVSLLIGGVVSGLFQFGYPQLALALIYVDQRMRKENLATALIASSAVPTQVREQT
ncbi:hypothetical protein ACIRP0_07335 [Streptomyces sp. NPDC101733]|uniref:hypothetical protein n=1 Tax=unclassified Streptomyces TaxID=2593676 RepID=UPI0037F7FBD5